MVHRFTIRRVRTVMSGKNVLAFAILITLPLPISGQTFEVASIKPAAPQPEGRFSIRMSVDSARLLYTGVSIQDILKQAYKVQDDQISGPEWLGRGRFDIVAKIPAGVPKDQVPQMLQNLLAERFGVSLHHETKELTRYALTVAGGGSKLQKADTSTGVTGEFGKARSRISGKITMEQLADVLAKQLARPVVDHTRLAGVFQIALEWAPDVPPGADGATQPAPGLSILTALQEQLGLKLSAGRGPVDMVVIDHAEKAPTEN